jgi:hypothetical protein
LKQWIAFVLRGSKRNAKLRRYFLFVAEFVLVIVLLIREINLRPIVVSASARQRSLSDILVLSLSTYNRAATHPRSMVRRRRRGGIAEKLLHPMLKKNKSGYHAG